MFSSNQRIVYTAIVPGMYLVNSTSSKDQINDSSFYISLHKILRMNKNSEGPNTEDQNGENKSLLAEEIKENSMGFLNKLRIRTRYEFVVTGYEFVVWKEKIWDFP